MEKNMNTYLKLIVLILGAILLTYLYNTRRKTEFESCYEMCRSEAALDATRCIVLCGGYQPNR